MHHDIPDLLPNRLNFDAIIFLGCTMKELQVIALTSLIGCFLLLGTLTYWLLGMVLIGIGLSFPTCVAVTWLIAQAFQKAKQGKPKGYMKQRFLIRCENAGLYKTPYTRRSGRWSIGRRHP